MSSSNSEKRKRDCYSDEEEDNEPFISIKPISASKLQAFTVGSQKKSAFQKHKEEADLKKQQDELEAAKVYADFVASFENPTPYKLGTTSFIKSGTLQPRGIDSVEDEYSQQSASKSTFKPMPFVKAGESTQPIQPMAFVKASSGKLQSPVSKSTSNFKSTPFMQAQQPTKINMSSFKSKSFVKAAKSLVPKNLQEMDDESDDDEDALAKLKQSKLQKNRNLDSFLEEIKKGQEDRNKFEGKNTSESLSGQGMQVTQDEMGSHDDGNPNTTNLYVGNINPTITETGLCQEFGKFGPIASVKIMWPRTQDEKDKGNNCGFVSFMTRQDAAEAIKHLDGKDVEGFVMRVGWGKSVKLPPVPFFVLDKMEPVQKSGLPFNAQINGESSGINSRPRAEVKVVKPVDLKIMRTIHRFIERLIKYGPMFEAIIMDKEHQNPTFKFLYDNTSPEHIYYRWKLYSLLQGDTKTHWFDEPFQMFEGGPWWIPPELPLTNSDEPLFDTDDELVDADNAEKGTLGPIAKQRLSVLISQVSFQRGTIARTMAFAIDHAEAAVEIVDLLCKSVLLNDIPLSVKLARLYLISDILHNSSVHVSNAWKFRKEFEFKMPIIFDHFNTIYRSINARLKAEQVRRHISAVISVWENWMIFPKYYTDQLTEIFLKKESGKQDVVSNYSDNDNYNVDIDGEPLEDDVNDDVDGEPIEEEEDVDGEPIDQEDDNVMLDVQSNSRKETLYTDITDMFS